MKIFVGHTGKSTLDWTAKAASSAWLSITNPNGTSGDSISVVANPTGLALGVYRDTVIVTSSVGGTISVPVRFEIDSCSLTPIASNGGQVTDTLNSADCGAPNRPGDQAEFFTFTGTAGNVVSVLLSAGFNGFVALDTTTANGFAPLDTASQCLGNTKAPCIYYYTLPSSSAKYDIEVSSATPADTGLFTIRLIGNNNGGRDPNQLQALQQFLIPDSTKQVNIGDTVTASVLVHAVVSDSDVVDSLRLQAEWAPLGTAFLNQPMKTGAYTRNGDTASVIMTGLSDNTPYHWQVRAVDQTGNFSSPWDSLPRGNSPDFIVQLRHNPNPPSNLVQFQSDGLTQIQPGGYANTTTVRFSGTVSSPDPGDTLHLDVEVEPIGTAFTGNTSPNQTFTTSGNPGTSVATIIAPTIADRTSYHWAARTVGNTGRTSTWVPFGGSPYDFRDSVQSNFNLVFTPGPPAQVTAGIAMSPAVQVTAQDANSKTITGFTGNVTMSIASGPPGGAFSPRSTTIVAAVAGVANFPNLILTKVGTYTLQASAVFSGTTVLSLASNAINVIPAPAKQLAFTAGPPTSTQAGTAITPLQVSALDSLGNVASTFGGPVTLAITTGTGKTGAHLVNPGPVTAIAGVATFTTAYIDSTGSGYALTAASSGVTSGTSTSFNITPGPATHLVFAVGPSTTTATSAITPAVQVAAHDQFENTATSFTGSVTVAIGTNPSGGIMSSGTPNPATAVSGIATFPSLSIDKIGTGYTLTASTTGLTGATSLPFNIVNSTVSPTLSGVVATTPITVCQTGCSPGAGTASLITVTVKDLSGQPVAGATVALSAPTGTGNTFTQPGPTNASGVTTGTMTSTVAQIENVIAVANGVTITQQPPVTVNPGPPVSLAFTVTGQPSNTTAGVSINSGSGVVVVAKDQFSNTATSFSSNVTMAIATGPGTTLTGTTTVTAVAGMATFTSLRIRTPVGSYTLQASSSVPVLTSPQSNAFTISAAPASRDTFIVQPVQTAVLAKIDSAVGGVVVWITDSIGNLVNSSNNVTIALFDNTEGATLGGTKTRAAVAGVATFNDLTVSKISVGSTPYTLIANSSGLASDVSAPFDIVPGPAKTLVFKTQPTNATAGTSITPAVQVAALDIAGDTATGFTGNVTMAIGTNPSGGTLSGTNPIAAVAGIATFSNLSIDKAGNGYALVASTPALPSGPVTNGSSNAFNILPGGVSASQSTISALPAAITACKTGCSPGASTASTITVTAKDNLGNPIAGATVVLGSTSTSASITQPASATDVNGRTTGTISDTAAPGLPQTVSAVITLAPNPPVTITPTASVTVNAAAAAAAFFIRVPTNTAAGATINPSTGVQVQINDQFGNKVASASNTVSLSILVPPSPPGGVLSGTTSKAAVSGVATFTNLSIAQAATGYELLAQSTGLASDTGLPAFNITPAAAAKLGFGQQPTSATSGATISPAVTVRILDASGNLVTTATNNVTLAITPATGTAGAHLSGGTSVTVAASGGVATFSTLSIDSAGTGYTLNATASGLTGATSTTFSITPGAAAKLAFGQQPTGTTAGATISPPATVRILDNIGNLVTSASNTVSLSIATGTAGAHLSGGSTVSVAASGGVATFSTLNIDSAGTGYTLNAGASGLTGTTSAAFTITAGAAAQLVFGQQPTNTTGGTTITPAVTVHILDALGNQTTASNSIALAISAGTGTAGAHLSGGASTPASGGIATFSALSIDSAGTAYTLQATATGLSSSTSSSFNVSVGAPAQLAFSQQPTNTAANGTITPAVTVMVLDAGGNFVSTATNMIGLTIGANPGGGSLTGGSPIAAVGGVATFSGLSISAAGNGYTLVAGASGLTGATSLLFNIM